MKKINTAIADAFGKTESGKFLVVEVKAIGPRVHHIKELAHSTLVELTRTTHYYRKRFSWVMEARVNAGKPTVQTPFDLFKIAKSVLREVGARGGSEYNKALMTLQYTWQTQRTLEETVELILPTPVEK
jgi:hypothetical protein